MIRVYIIAADTPQPIRFGLAGRERMPVEAIGETIAPELLTDFPTIERIRDEFRAFFSREARYG